MMAAYSMPGSAVSMPYLICPFTRSALSIRLTGLPAIFQSLGDFRVIALGSGGVSFDAAEATWP